MLGRRVWMCIDTTKAYHTCAEFRPQSAPDGVWVADAQPGYWDSNHRWRAGPARGYYDTRGVWIATAVAASGADVSYDSGRDQGGMRRDVDTRESMLEQRIRTASADGTLDRQDASHAFGQLNSIRHQERDMRRYSGQLSSSDEQRLQDRLDQLSASLRTQLRGGGF